MRCPFPGHGGAELQLLAEQQVLQGWVTALGLQSSHINCSVAGGGEAAKWTETQPGLALPRSRGSLSLSFAVLSLLTALLHHMQMSEMSCSLLLRKESFAISTVRS